MTEIEEMNLVIETVGKMDIKASIKCSVLKHVGTMIKKKEIRELTKVDGVEPVQLHKTPNSTLCNINNNLTAALQEYENCKQAIKILDEQRSDILHYIELYDLGDSDMIKVSKELKRISKARRMYKNHKFQLEPLKELSVVLKHNAQSQINNAISESCKRAGKVKQQKYTEKQISLMDILGHN